MAKLEPFSRCRSETTRTRSSGQYSAPSQFIATVTSAMVISAVAACWLEAGGAREAEWAFRAPLPWSLHCLLHEFRLSFRQQRIGRLAGDGLAADFKSDRARERRDVIKRPVNDSALDTCEHIAQTPNVEETSGCVGARGAKEDVVGLMAAEHVVDEIGRDRDFPARLLLARKAAFDQPRDDRTG